MARRFFSTKHAGPPWLAIGASVGALLLGTVAFLLHDQAQRLFHAGLNAALGVREYQHDTAWIGLDGHLSASNLVIPATSGRTAHVASFAAVSMETPGWGWLLQHMFDRKSTVGWLDELRMRFVDGAAPAGTQVVAGELAPFGIVSAALFDSAGCLEQTQLSAAELHAMGLSTRITTFRIEQVLFGDELRSKTVLETAGSARVIYERTERLATSARPLAVDPREARITSERWEVTDFGFAESRNSWCAKSDKITVPEYIDRHLESVDRALESGGLAIDRRSLSVYREYLINGGGLRFSARYDQPALRSELLADMRDPSLLSGSDGVLERAGKRSLVQFEAVTPRPFAETVAHLPIYAAIQAERAAESGELAVAATNSVEPENAIESTIQTTQPATVATTAAPIFSEPPAPARVKAAAGVSTREIIPPPKIVTIGNQRRQLAWGDLANHVGRSVRIETTSGTRAAEIVAFEQSVVRIRTRVGGGSGELNIQRSAFKRAEPIAD